MAGGCIEREANRGREEGDIGDWMFGSTYLQVNGEWSIGLHGCPHFTDPSWHVNEERKSAMSGEGL